MERQMMNERMNTNGESDKVWEK